MNPSLIIWKVTCSKTDLFPVLILSINFKCTSPAIVLEAIFAPYPERDSTKTFTGEQQKFHNVLAF